MNSHSRDEILASVIETLASVNPALANATADTPLLGSTAAVDSVGFVTLLVGLEQNLGASLVPSFLEQGGVSDQDNPFRTVASLSDHIYGQQTAPVP
jgi:acyl carrier protein